jgi:transglutaminase-like putative cysteine protease
LIAYLIPLSPFRFLAGISFFLIGLMPLSAQVPVSVSRTPPEAYAEQAEPLLTPLSKILSAPAPAEKDAIAQVLIDESVHIVAEDGRVLRVRHVAYRALTEAALKALGEDVFSYGRDRQKFHLVRAVAIQPDGTEQAVASDAIIVQSPQHQSKLAIYDDTTEVRIIYPRIPVGGVTQTITINEDTEARVPGVYTMRSAWGGGWPTALERLVVDLPESMSERLRWFTLGPGAVEPVRETVPSSRIRLTWERDAIRMTPYEVERAPAMQTGPSLHLTTLAQWDEVAAWFQSLITGRDQLPPELAANVDEWVKSAPNRDAVISTLFSKVADEIRYTSLALNEGDYQPQACAEVWARRHGDCKDKSNLLVALLRRAGIAAHIALLNTTHVGFIDRRAPDYRVFTHAIVAIPDGQGGYTFCDPTNASGAPGVYAPSVAGRDALVIRDGRADWAHIPPQKAGNLAYVFDLALSPAGEISGWLTLTADGIYGAWERERYRNQDNPSRRSALSRIVRGFFAGAEVIDVVTPDPTTAPGPAVARAYFVVSAQSDAATGPSALIFPRSPSLFLNLGTTESRETAYFLYQDQIRVSASFKLPAGTTTGAVPAAFQLGTPAALVDARWQTEPGVVRAELRFDVLQSSLAPREFARFYQAMLALDSWLGQPLSLRTDGTTAPIAPVAAAIDMPLMPSGRGQLDLIDKRYPYSGNREVRRAALQRALQYFPNDPATAYEAGVHLAVLDWNEDRNQEAIDRIVALLAAHRSILAPGMIAWGESIQGLALRDLGRTDEAVALFTGIARNSTVGAWRRSLDALNAVNILKTSDPAAALQLATECSLLVSEYQPQLLAHVVRLGLDLKPDLALQEHLVSVTRAQPAELDSFLAHITKSSVAWTDSDAAAKRSRWLVIANALAPSPGTEFAAALKEASAAGERLAAAVEIQRRLREAVARPPLAAWFGAADAPASESWDAYTAERAKLVEKNESNACALLGVRALLAFPADEETLTRLWRVSTDADWQERRVPGSPAAALLPLMLDLSDLVPKPHDSYYDGRFLRAAVLARGGDYVGERAIFTELFADPQFPSGFHLTGYARLGLSCEHLGDFPAALAAYQKLENDVANSDRNTDAILRAVLINLHLDRPAEALRLIGVLEGATEATLLKASTEYFIREFIALRRSGRAESFWAARNTWWPQWEAIVSALRLPAPARETIVPVIPELSVFGKNLRKAEKEKNSAVFWGEFRMLVSAARWLPSLAPEVSSLISQSIAQAPAHKGALNRLVMTQLAIPGTPDENMRLREFHIIATLYDTGDYTDSLAAAAAFLKAQPDTEALRSAVVRVYAMAALAAGRDLVEASAELERVLANPATNDRRAYNVELLAKLYRTRHLGEEESALLERELANPHIIADVNAKTELSDRFEKLGGSLKLASHVSEWLRANSLPWYDFAEPASLADSRLRDLTAVLDNPERQFMPAEIIKLKLLAAQNPEIGLAVQSEALRDALTGLHAYAPTNAEAARVADAFVDDARFDESIRASFLWHLLVDSYNKDRRADFDRWRNHALCVRFNQVQNAYVTAMVRNHGVDQNDAKALASFADEFQSKDVGDVEIDMLQEVFLNYLRLDELEHARALVDSIQGWRYASGYSGSSAANILRFTRTLRTVEAKAPVHRALVDRVRKEFADLPALPPSAYAALRLEPGELPDLLDTDTREAGLWMIGTRRINRQNFDFWENFVPSIYHDPVRKALAFELIEIALQAAPDDETRAEVLAALFYTVDYDEPETLARLRAIVAPYADPIAHPLSARYLKVQNARLGVRFGEATDFEATLRMLDAPEDSFIRTIITLRRHLQRNDVAALKRTLRALDAETLLNSQLVYLTTPALEKAGLTIEHRLARETAEKEQRRAILDAWLTADPRMVDRALDLAEMLGRPDPFPAGWVKSVSERCSNPMYRGHARIMDAWLRSDWTTAAREAKTVLRDYPTYHRFQWYAGAALHRAGKTAEARPHLETYVRYANDEIEHPAAQALLGIKTE